MHKPMFVIKPAHHLFTSSKITITVFALLLFVNSHAQQSGAQKLTINEVNMYGYVNGIRLDSVPGKFIVLETGEFSGTHTINPYDVDFGQEKPLLATTVIRNKEGRKLIFNGLATLLNFFDFSGWQLNRIVTSSAFGRDIEIIFERKK